MSTCLTCMGSQVRVLYCPPSSRTKKDIYAKNPEVSTTSGFFCAQFLKSEKKISKRVLAKSMDLNLYPRHFEPLFRGFFGAFSCILQSKSSTIFLKSRFDPNRDPNRDVRRCTKRYAMARKDHSAAHKTYIKSVFFHKKRARCRFGSAPAMPCVTPLPG